MGKLLKEHIIIFIEEILNDGNLNEAIKRVKATALN